MLTSAILRFFSRDIDALVAFINKLDARLDAFMARHDAEVAAFEQDIEDTLNDAHLRVAQIEEKIEDKLKAAAIVAGIKAALPTAK